MKNLKLGDRVIAYGAVKQLDGPVRLGPTKGTVTKITTNYILICSDFEPGEDRLKHYRAHPKQCRRLKCSAAEPTSNYVNQDREKSFSEEPLAALKKLHTPIMCVTMTQIDPPKVEEIVDIAPLPKLPTARPPIPKRLSRQILWEALQYANSSLSHKPWMELMIEKIEELTKVKVIDEEKMDGTNYRDYNC